MLIPTKTVAAAAFLGLLVSPVMAQVEHEGMTCTDFQQSTPETQTEVVAGFMAEETAMTEMTSEEIVSMVLDACNEDAAADDTAHSKFVDAMAG